MSRQLFLAALLAGVLAGCSPQVPGGPQTVAASAPTPARVLPTIGFKGLELGQPLTRKDVLDKLGTVCNTGTTPGFTCYDDNESIASVRSTMLLEVGSDGRLQSVYLQFPADEFSVVVEALRSKWGVPDASEGDAGGSRFQQYLVSWNGADGAHLVAQRISGKPGTASVNYISQAGIRQSEEWARKREAARLKDQ